MKTRLEWLDLLKGLGILLVVTGHTSFPVNVWIYSFHMPLFFFTSAVGLRLDRDTPLGPFIIKRVRTLLVPFFCYSLILIAVGRILQRYQIEFGCAGSVHDLFAYLATPPNAGATWFLVVLAEASILLALSRKWLASRSILLSLGGLVSAAVLFKTKHLLPWNLDLALFAWFLMDLGYALKPYFLRFEPRQKTSMILLVLSLIVTYVLCWVHWAKMNWPPRTFDPNLLLNVLSAFAGIYTLTFVAKCLSRVAHRLGFLFWLGQNSIGILMFHFIGFKVGFLLLGADSYSKLVPGENDFWVWYLLFGVGVSVVLTLILSRFAITRRLLLGKN